MLVYILDKNVRHIPFKDFSQPPSYIFLNLGTSKTLEYLNFLTEESVQIPKFTGRMSYPLFKEPCEMLWIFKP